MKMTSSSPGLSFPETSIHQDSPVLYTSTRFLTVLCFNLKDSELRRSRFVSILFDFLEETTLGLPNKMLQGNLALTATSLSSIKQLTGQFSDSTTINLNRNSFSAKKTTLLLFASFPDTL